MGRYCRIIYNMRFCRKCKRLLLTYTEAHIHCKLCDPEEKETRDKIWYTMEPKIFEKYSKFSHGGMSQKDNWKKLEEICKLN